MKKFKFSKSTPAKVANPAKMPVNKGNPSANVLLKSANVDRKKQGGAATLANISNSLASEEPFEINNLSNFSNISSTQDVNLKKTPQQKYDMLWKKADALADWIDNPDSNVPWQERAARVPELQQMSMMISELELLIRKTDMPIDRETTTKPITCGDCQYTDKQKKFCFYTTLKEGKPGKPVPVDHAILNCPLKLKEKAK